MPVLEMAAGAVEEPRPVTDPSLDIRVLQRPTLVQPKVPKPLQENPAEANRTFAFSACPVILNFRARCCTPHPHQVGF